MWPETLEKMMFHGSGEQRFSYVATRSLHRQQALIGLNLKTRDFQPGAREHLCALRWFGGALSNRLKLCSRAPLLLLPTILATL